jgi:hypothetical protein
MVASTSKRFSPTRSLTGARAVLLIGVAALAVGCFVPPPPVQTTTIQPAPVVYQAPAPVATTAYVPQYYQGNVVYFDTSGYPFYYLNGASTYVPRSCTCYVELINHYRTYQVGYQQWFASEGSRLISLGLNLGL